MMVSNQMAPVWVEKNDIQYWLALWRLKGVGSQVFKRALYFFGSPKKVFEQELPKLIQFGFSQEACSQISCYSSGNNDPVSIGVDRDLHWLSHDNRHILTWNDPLYPPMLKMIHDAPPVLFVHGNPVLLHDIQVAIVGSRRPSRAGIENAKAFSSHLLELGIIPTSGLALGIDGAAHQAAVDNQQPTIAVMGNGLDIVYPKKHHRLAEQIVEYGAIVTEFGTGVAPQASHFPRRNRIISGLSVGVLVVEAAIKSGSLITARMALDQGREVFAIPGSIHNPMAKGCHALIRDGAKLVETAEHILEEVQSLLQLQSPIQAQTPIQAQSPIQQTANKNDLVVATENVTEQLALIGKPNEEEKRSVRPNATGDLCDQEQLIIDCLDFAPTPLDILVTRTGLDSKKLASIIVMLEIKGYVSAEPGGYSLFR